MEKKQISIHPKVHEAIEKIAFKCMLAVVIDRLDDSLPGFRKDVAARYEYLIAHKFVDEPLREEVLAILRDIGSSLAGSPDMGADPEGG